MIWQALILAGQRKAEDKVALSARVAVKALAEVGQKPMLRRVYDALSTLDKITDIKIIGNVKLLKQNQKMADLPDQSWIEGERLLPLSIRKAIDLIGLDHPLLITTADHALLQPTWVETFLQQSTASGADCTVGFAKFNKGPSIPAFNNRTFYRFKDGNYSSCNLFAVMKPPGVGAIKKWEEIHEHRKRPWCVISKIGYLPLLQFALGQLSIEAGFTQISRRANCQIKPVIIPDQLAAVDVDGVDDWRLVQELVDKAGSDS